MPSLQEAVDHVFLIITGEVGETSIEFHAVPDDAPINALRLGHSTVGNPSRDPYQHGEAPEMD